MRFVERSGIPTTVSLLDKSAIDERHPSFIGVYAGALGRQEVQDTLREATALSGSAHFPPTSTSASIPPTSIRHAASTRPVTG